MRLDRDHHGSDAERSVSAAIEAKALSWRSMPIRYSDEFAVASMATGRKAMADTLELEHVAARLGQSGDYRILRRIPEVDRYAADDGAPKRLGLIFDIEKTGLDPGRDKIIEFALLPFEFSSDGVIYGVQDGYAGFEDPGRPLPEEVIRLTGITDDKVRDHRLDDRVVEALVAPANLIIAHNAAFDRRFLERRFQLFVAERADCAGSTAAIAARPSTPSPGRRWRICTIRAARSRSPSRLVKEKQCAGRQPGATWR